MSQHTDAQEQRVSEREFLIQIRDHVMGYGERPPALWKVEEMVNARLRVIDASQPASAAPHNDLAKPETLNPQGQRPSLGAKIAWEPFNGGSYNPHWSGYTAAAASTGFPERGWCLYSRGAGDCWNQRTKTVLPPYEGAEPVRVNGEWSWTRSGSTNAAGGSSPVGSVEAEGQEWTVKTGGNYCFIDDCAFWIGCKDELEKLAAKHNASLRADGRAETGEDTKRLDWLEKNYEQIERMGEKWWSVNIDEWALTLRAAIDAARASSNPEPVSSPASSQQDSGSETRNPPTDVAPTSQSDTARLYHELLFAVESKHDGETRHQTALRYIREREVSPASSQAEREEEA